jgi:dynein heavy chain
MMCSPQTIKTDDQLIKLWIHEVSRVFHDRLINESDRMWFYDLITELLNKSFKGLYERKDLFEDRSIIFSDIMKLD